MSGGAVHESCLHVAFRDMVLLVHLAELGLWLDSMIFVVPANQNDSMILLFRGTLLQEVTWAFVPVSP